MSALAVTAIAQRELKKNISNLWLPLVAGLLLIVNLGVTRIGFAFAEPESSIDSRALLLSLIHLQMYAVPLFAFVLSYAGVCFRMLESSPSGSRERWICCSPTRSRIEI